MITGVPIINGTARTHSDIVINIFGTPIIGVTEINYTDEQAMTNNYSAGSNEPSSVSLGDIAYTASVTLTFEAVQALQNVANAKGAGRIQNLGFHTIGVNFMGEGVPVRHALRVRFKGRGVASTQGNDQIVETLQLHCVGINYNA